MYNNYLEVGMHVFYDFNSLIFHLMYMENDLLSELAEETTYSTTHAHPHTITKK